MFIARGVPGSGKSHTISKVVPKDNIFSTDQYWGPNYNFDPSKLKEAHQWNFQRATDAVLNGLTPIGIDNTNIRWWEIKPYVELAKNNGYTVKYIEANSPWWNDISKKLNNDD